MANEHLRDDRDVEQILKLAVNKAGYTDEEALRQRLMAAAGELGLTEQQVLAAEKEYAEKKVVEAEQAEYDKFVHQEFWEHFWAYIIVNAGMIGFNLVQRGNLGWAIWPLIGWGIGIAFHAYSTFAKSSESYQEELDKWRKGRRRRRRSRGLVVGVSVGELGARTRKSAEAELDDG